MYCGDHRVGKICAVQGRRLWCRGSGLVGVVEPDFWISRGKGAEEAGWMREGLTSPPFATRLFGRLNSVLN